MSNKKSNNKNDGEINIPSDVKEFAKANYKKYKKNNKGYYDSKKERKETYMLYLLDLLPKTIMFMVKYGYIKNDELQKTKDKVYAKFIEDDFNEFIIKEIEDGAEIENIKYLPIIYREIMGEMNRLNNEALAEDPNAKLPHDMRLMVECVKAIMKKKLKKMKKADVPMKVAFDTLCIIPCDDALESSQFYRIRMFYECLYEHAKTTAIPFNALMDVIVKKEKYYSMFITFALLERKEKFTSLTDSQKKLYMDISNWCFDTMENKIDDANLNTMLKVYVSKRRRDESQGKDSNRRYVLSTLSETDYERIAKTVKNMIAKDDSLKKYL